MDEKKPSPLDGIFEEGSPTPEKEGKAYRVADYAPDGGNPPVIPSASDNGHVDISTLMQRYELDSIHRTQTLIKRSERLEMSLGAIRALAGIALLVAGYAVFQTRKLQKQLKGGKPNEEAVETGNTDTDPQ